MGKKAKAGSYKKPNSYNGRKKIIKPPQINPQPPQIKPPREWKNFAELKFRVSDIQTNATSTNIMDAFTTYGNVYRVEIETKETYVSPECSNGTAYIIFKPVPAYPFWNKSSDTFTDYSFPAESLELGDYLLSGVFVSEAKFTQSVKFSINHRKQKIIVEFGHKVRTFKLEIDFKDIIDDIYSELDASQQRSRSSITIENKYPAKYWVLDKYQKSNKFNWCIVMILLKVTEDGKKMPRFHKNNEEPGKWLVFRITFDLDQVLELIENAGEYNLAPRTSNISNFPLKIVRVTDLRKHFVNRSLLNFEVNYMVECNISFNYLNEYNLCEEFFSLLSQQPTSKVGSSSSNSDTSNDALYNGVYRALRDGITIGDRHYEFLALSASRLRDHSSKYVGQCFSSTRAIQRLPINDIEEILDIVRNGFTFSDGKIAYELYLKTIPSAFQIKMAGYKGVLFQLINVKNNQVQVRPSQHNVLEVIRDLRVRKLDKMLESEHTVLGALQRNVDEYGISTSLADLVKAEFLRNNDRVLNVTETLHKCQIYCCISDPCNPSSKKVITGRCIVLRNPCFHPGDICIVTALTCKALSHLVDVAEPPEFSLTTSMDMVAGGLGLYQDRWSELFGKCWATSIVREAVGYRDIPSECSGGDLDGANKRNRCETSENKVQCICLAQLRSDAVDSPKTGTPPEFPPVLRVKEPQTNLNVENFDQRLYADAYEEFLYGARKLKREYDANIRGLMNQFGIITEIEVTSGYIVNTITKVDKKEPRDVKKSVMEALIPIKRHYRKLFEEEFLSKDLVRMESKAYAWYYVSYHPSELDDDSENMISFPWVAHDVTLPVEKIVKLKVSKSFHA
ncbi:10547_t:CDS:10 [Rhizophagus irregularis]|nr:10547_t:CDS:10 [Rhizophagus irregularis]